MPHPEQIGRVLEELRNESPRACAVLAGGLLDDLLLCLFERVLLEDERSEVFHSSGALSTFSSRIRMAYVLGFIAKDESRDLHLIRKIRNDFAHAIDKPYAFALSPTKERVNELKTVSVLDGWNDPILIPIKDLWEAEMRNNLRLKFELSVGILAALLEERPDHIIKVTERPEAFVTRTA